MFRGSMVAMVTPMLDDGSVDETSMQRLVDFHVDSGTDAIVAVGTTGESATLDHDEHHYVVKRVIEMVNRRVPVIAGTGANSTSEALSLTQAAREAGADACLLVTPYYNKPPQEGLYLHFKAIAEQVDIPQILYNVPGRTACDMLPETVARLASLPNIIGIKEATGDLDRVHELKRLCGDEFEIYSGEDWLAREVMLAGGHGVISVTANVAPAQMHEMSMLALDGDAEGSKRIDDTLRGLHDELFCESNPIPAKWALAEMGLMQPAIRLPLRPLDGQFHDRVRAAMRAAEAVPA